MPYASIEDTRRYHRELHNEKYWTKPGFREYEKERKAEWYQANKEKAAARLRAWREKKRAAGEPIAAPKVEKLKLLRLEKQSA